MQIKYLKDAPLGQAGETHEVPDDQAKVLITLGIAEIYDGKDGDNDNGDLFGQLDDSQSADSEPPATAQEPSETDETTEPTADDQEPSKADEVSEQVQEVAETTLAEPATPTETAKPKKTKKTNTENN